MRLFFCLHLLIVLAIITILFPAISLAQQLSEKEQLDLLEKADQYYNSEGRKRDETIRLYQEVLDKVDLAQEIRLEIMFNIGNMYLFQMNRRDAEQPDERKALAVYQAIIEQFPENNVTAFRSHGYSGDCYWRLGDRKNAEKEYLYVRKFIGSVPEEERPKYKHFLDAWNKGTLSNLVSVYADLGGAGIPDLKRLIEENPDDAELIASAEAAINQIPQNVIEESALLLDNIVQRGFPKKDPPALPKDPLSVAENEFNRIKSKNVASRQSPDVQSNEGKTATGGLVALVVCAAIITVTVTIKTLKHKSNDSE